VRHRCVGANFGEKSRRGVPPEHGSHLKAVVGCGGRLAVSELVAFVLTAKVLLLLPGLELRISRVVEKISNLKKLATF
jgi:hypothetical protein